MNLARKGCAEQTKPRVWDNRDATHTGKIMGNDNDFNEDFFEIWLKKELAQTQNASKSSDTWPRKIAQERIYKLECALMILAEYRISVVNALE